MTFFGWMSDSRIARLALPFSAGRGSARQRLAAKNSEDRDGIVRQDAVRIADDDRHIRFGLGQLGLDLGDCNLAGVPTALFFLEGNCLSELRVRLAQQVFVPVAGIFHVARDDLIPIFRTRLDGWPVRTSKRKHDLSHETSPGSLQAAAASLRSIASLQRISKYAFARRFLARLASGPF